MGESPPEGNISYQIAHQCPQCGAPAVLEETDRLITCEFCKVRSYLTQKDYFRYVLPNSAPKNREIVYFPYWRFKGMIFICARDGVHQRFTDVSSQAAPSRFFPESLGLRAQAMKLRFVSSETPGRFIKPVLTIGQVVEEFEKRFGLSLKGAIYHHAHIGEAISLIYAPFYVDSRVHDAVLNRPVSPVLPPDFSLEDFPSTPPSWPGKFLPTMCPNCGWDLIGGRDSLALACKNCNSMWLSTENELKQIGFSCMGGAGDEDSVYLPFWRITAEVAGVEGLRLHSCADLVRLANLPKVVQKEMEETRFRFWAPAFKIRPRAFLRISRGFTIAQPAEPLEKMMPGAKAHPVTMPVKEAVESLKINLGGLIAGQRKLYPRLPEINIRAQTALLVYIPFHEGHHDLTHPEYSMCVNKNALSLSYNL